MTVLEKYRHTNTWFGPQSSPDRKTGGSKCEEEWRIYWDTKYSHWGFTCYTRKHCSLQTETCQNLNQVVKLSTTKNGTNWYWVLPSWNTDRDSRAYFLGRKNKQKKPHTQERKHTSYVITPRSPEADRQRKHMMSSSYVTDCPADLSTPRTYIQNKLLPDWSS